VDLENAFDRIRSNYGSQVQRDFITPNGVDRVCFVDTQVDPLLRPFKGLCITSGPYYDPLMCNEWKGNTSAVLFSPIIETDIDIGAVVISDPKYLCFNTSKSRKVSLNLIGLGNRVKVERQ